MRRRELLLGAGATALFSGTAGAQTRTGPPRLGVLRYGSPKDDKAMQPFLSAMNSLGYIAGKTVSYDYRYANGAVDRLPGLASELAASSPNIMMAFGGDLAPYVRDAARSLPIVFSVSADPVQLGLVASLSRPERNATGVTFLHDKLGSKRLQLLKEAVPHVEQVAFLWNPKHLDNDLADTSRAAEGLKVRLLSLPVITAAELQPALDQATAAGVDSIYVVTSTLLVNLMPQIIRYANNKRLPLVGGWGAWAMAGGLMSYGPDVDVMVSRTAAFVDKILKGTRPSDIPVEQPTKFELTLNLKAAKAIGVRIQESYLVGVDHIIE